MLSDIVRLSDHDLDRLIHGLSRGTIGPEATLSQIRKLGIQGHPDRILSWIYEALLQFGSMTGVAAALRLIREDRDRAEQQSLPAELILTGPAIEGTSNRDTRVVVREIFEKVERSILIVGYAFYESDAIFEPLARRMGEDEVIRTYLVVNIHPIAGLSPERTVAQFSDTFFRSSWPFHPKPSIYYLPESMDARGSIRASVHAKVIVADRETVYLGSANFTGAAFHRNIEAGLCLGNARLGNQLADYFEQLIVSGILMPLQINRL